MSILVDADTRLVVQGITGREGAFHATRNKAYGTNVVAGVTPGQGAARTSRASRCSTPCADAVEATEANTAMVFVPPRFATDALYEAIESGVDLVVCITEGIPAHDMLRVYTHLRAAPRPWSARTARASSARASPASGSCRRRSSRRAASAW